MIRTHNPALEQRPKAFDGVGMNSADYVFALAVIDHAVWVLFVKAHVATPLVCAKQTDLLRNGALHESGQSLSANAIDDAGNYATFATHSTSNDCLTRSTSTTGATRSAGAATFVLVPVLRLTADEGFVRFDDAHQLAEILILHTGTDAMAHMPRGAVGAEPEHAVYLQSANAFLADQHEVNDFEPLRQRFVGVLEHSADQHREAVAVGVTLFAGPVIGTAWKFVRVHSAATRAANASRPAAGNQIVFARLIGRELAFQLREGHLMNSDHGSASVGYGNHDTPNLCWCQVEHNHPYLQPWISTG